MRRFHFAMMLFLLATLVMMMRSSAQADVERKPTPPADELARVNEKLREAYGIDSISSDKDRLKLATDLVKLASVPGTNATESFVLQKEAVLLAAGSGDLEYSMMIAHSLAAQFEVNALEMKCAAVALFAGNAKNRVAIETVMAELSLLVQDAKKQEEFAVGAAITQDVSQKIAKAAGSKFRKELADWSTELLQEDQDFNAYKASAATILTRPEDADANLVVGQWLCLKRADWKTGLPLLSRGSDQPLALASQADLANPSTTDSIMSVADGWYKIGQTSPLQRAYASRAKMWYALILRNATGIDKAKAAKRIEELEVSMGEDSRSAGIRFVEIPAGEFVFHFVQADSKGRRIDGRRKVLIPKPFEMSTYEVTQAQYEIVMGTNPSYFRRPVNPVEQVSWDDANEFCRRLSESPDEKAFGYSYRLPTEEEWEYACRAGSTTVFSFGDDEAKLPEFAWFADNSGANRLESAKLVATLNNDMFAAAVIENNGRPHAVGRRKPNLFGLFDMHGNVYEWCGESGRSSSAEKAYRAAVPDPAIRGGSWWVDPGRCQSAFRHTFNQAFRNADIGFRVVRERTTLSP